MKTATAIMALLMTTAVHAQKPTTLTFAVQDKTTEPVELMCEDLDTLIALDSNGKASFKMPLSEPKYAVIRYKFKTSTIYLEPKKKLDITWDMTPAALVVDFKGKNADKNLLINGKELQGPVMGDFGKQESELLEILEDYEAKDLDILKSKNFDATFTSKDTRRIQFWIYGMLCQYASTRVCSEDTYTKLESLVSQEDWLMQLKSYTNFMLGAVTVLANRGQAADEVKPLQRTMNCLNYILANIKSTGIRDFLIGTYAIEQVANNGVKGAEGVKDIVEKNVTDKEILQAFEAAYEKASSTSQGVPSPDFKAVDINGKEYSLESFKGCVLYIDLWATWCGPCKEEAPNFKKMADMFVGSNLRFVSLSIDKDKSRWEQFVKDNVPAPAEGEECNTAQLWIGPDSQFLKDYEVDGIPRFIIIDKEGIIVNPNAPRPSDPQAIEAVGSLAE